MRYAGLVLLFLAGVAAYLPSFSVPFHFDDVEGILNNAYIRITSLSPSMLWAAAFQDYGHLRPLSNLTFALNYYFNVLNPFGYHLFNFFLHMVSGFCVFFLLERIFFRRTGDLGLARLMALLSALLWLVHPVNLQAVTYIIQRHSSMAGCFSLLALLCYDLGRSAKRKFYFLLTGLFLLGAFLSKETSFVMPAMVFIYDLWFFRGLEQGWAKKSWKWLLGLGGFYLLLALAVGLAVLRGGIAGKISLYYSDLNLTALERAYTEGRVLLWYLGLVYFPAGSRLNLDHEFKVSGSLLDPVTTIPAYLLIGGLLVLAMVRARKYPLLSFSILWYFGQLGIEALPLPIDLVNEHRLYLASIPLLAAVPRLLGPGRKNFWLGAVFIFLLGLCFGILTYERNRVWQVPVKLWRDTIMKSPGRNRPWNNYCTSLIDIDDIYRAGYACSYAIKLDPKKADTHANMGICLFKIGYNDAAEDEFKKAIELDPKYSVAYFNLGLVYAVRALRHPEGNDLELAKANWEKAMELKPTDAKVYYNLGAIYEKLNDPANAVRAYQIALSLRPEWVEARLKVAKAWAGQGRCGEALKLVQSSPVQDPRFQEIFNQCR